MAIAGRHYPTIPSDAAGTFKRDLAGPNHARLVIQRAVVRYSTYPLVVMGGTATIVASQATGSGYWPLVPLTLVLAAVVVAILERVQPYAPAWNVDHGDGRVDVLHLIGNVALSQISLLIFAAARPLWSGIGIWPNTWPFWAQALLALAVVDLGLYTVHRASHGLGWLWRLHAIHHSSRRIYWVNGQRRHLLHELVEGAPGLLVLFVAGAPAAAFATAIAIVTLHLLLQHANIDYRLGPFRRILSVAELHRWHHQRRWQDVQGNYAAVFSLWDQLFGTALRWRGDAPAEVGMDDEPDLPTNYLGQMGWPFARGRSS
ncbi:MAG: sterol desaturase family protein [Kofleriaceae bacterium]|nr:sterol desaturase family protein [Kofleriaceae bacterium]